MVESFIFFFSFIPGRHEALLGWDIFQLFWKSLNRYGTNVHCKVVYIDVGETEKTFLKLSPQDASA